MNYSDARKRIKTGDVILVAGKSWISKIIKFLTGESYSHIAMFVWMGDNLWISEMREFRGYQWLPASQWIAINSAGADLVWGHAPQAVLNNSDKVRDYALDERMPLARYGYSQLIKVFLSRFFACWDNDPETRGMPAVCSTYIQSQWSACGVKFKYRYADPGDFEKLATGSIKLEKG